jgi:hypothetical protein
MADQTAKLPCGMGGSLFGFVNRPRLILPMSGNQEQFLALVGRVPARLDVEQIAWLLNCQPHDVPVLVRARLLKPLGNPPANARKLFAADEVLELCRDKAWLGKVSNAISAGWRQKNRSRSTGAAVRPQPATDDAVVLSAPFTTLAPSGAARL